MPTRAASNRSIVALAALAFNQHTTLDTEWNPCSDGERRRIRAEHPVGTTPPCPTGHKPCRHARSQPLVVHIICGTPLSRSRSSRRRASSRSMATSAR